VYNKFPKLKRKKVTLDNINHEKLVNNISDIIKNASLFLNKNISPISDDYNPSTNVDIEISGFLTNKLTSLLDLPVISEENESQYALLSGDFVWIIDPLDGTLNALTKNKPFCISVSLLDLNSLQALLSCNYIPYNNELYSAIRGKGAFLNGTKIDVSHSSRKIVSYGLPNDTIQNVDFHLKHLKSILKEGYITRQSGSAVYDIIMTALGRHHAFYEFGLFLWDFISADLLATECGCKSFYKKSGKHPDQELRYDYIVSSDESSLNILKIILAV
jgi:myo-inositol-1(or 4)-monophosphatase